jgi:hypothetical protein
VQRRQHTDVGLWSSRSKMASCDETPDPLGAIALCSGCTQVTWTSLLSKLLERDTEGCLLPEAITRHWCRPAHPSAQSQCPGCSFMFALLGDAEADGFGIKTTQSILHISAQYNQRPIAANHDQPIPCRKCWKAFQSTSLERLLDRLFHFADMAQSVCERSRRHVLIQWHHIILYV